MRKRVITSAGLKNEQGRLEAFSDGVMAIMWLVPIADRNNVEQVATC